MKFDHSRGLRQSMSWLHTWSGLVLGWLLFAIFVTGTLSFFRDEITFWMQPELHLADGGRIAFDRALRVLAREAPDATQWSLILPGPRNPTLGLSWQNATGAGGGRAAPESAASGTPAASATDAALPGPGGEADAEQRQGGNHPAREGWRNGSGANGENGAGVTERSGRGGHAARSGRGAAQVHLPFPLPLAREEGARRQERDGDGSGENLEPEATPDERAARPRPSGGDGGRDTQARPAGGDTPRQGAVQETPRQGAAQETPRQGVAQGTPRQGAARAGTPQNRAQAHGGGGGGGHGRGPRVTLDPSTGERLAGRETAGGNFLYRFHFELYGVDRIWGFWIVGIATMFMLVAIVSGVIVHRRIFKDFFTFRPGRGKRSWLDAHNACSVMSLPFHIVITFSGLLLFGNMIFPGAIQSAYHGDTNAYWQEMRERMGVFEAPPPSGERAPLTDLGALARRAESAWGGRPAGSITIIHPGDRRAVVEVRQARGMSLAAGRASARSLRFDGVSGQALETAPPPPPSAVESIYNVFMMLHRGFFASPIPRWLLFLAGVGGSLMIASGLVMWRVARAGERERTGRVAFGQRLVEVFNVAGIAGLMIAIAAHFWANRLIPVDWPQRGEWEIKVFFLAWAASLVHALARRHQAAWIEQLAFAGVSIALLPVVNALTGGLSLFGSIYLGRWLPAGFDLCALAIGGGLVFAAAKVYRHRPAVRASKPEAAPEAAMETVMEAAMETAASRADEAVAPAAPPRSPETAAPPENIPRPAAARVTPLPPLPSLPPLPAEESA